MTTLNLGQDWKASVDAPNNRLIIEYEPNGTQFELNEDGTLAPLSGGVDTDLLNGADLSTATTGDVPQSDGAGNLTMAPVETEPNVPNWTEDANSPASVTGQTSLTFTLSNDYDEILILSDPDNIGMDGLRVNGNTEPDYGVLDTDGVSTGSLNEFPLSPSYRRQEIQLSAIRRNNAIGYTQQVTDSSTYEISGRLIGSSPPINQFTLFSTDGSTEDERIRVFGLTI